MKKVIRVVLCVILVVVLLLAGMIGMVITMGTKMDKEMEEISYREVDMNEVADGAYEGIYETTMIKAQVRVHVKNHKIEEIEILKHENGKGSKAETIVNDMVENNTFQVDTISGATASSKVIMCAVNNALLKGVQE